MDENEKKEPETAQEPPKPENYSRYMGTLNRIYRRNNNHKVISSVYSKAISKKGPGYCAAIGMVLRVYLGCNSIRYACPHR